MGQSGTKWDKVGQVVQSGTKWDRWYKVGQSGTGGTKWDKVGQVVQSGTKWDRWDKVGQSGTEWYKVGQSGTKWDSLQSTAGLKIRSHTSSLKHIEHMHNNGAVPKCKGFFSSAFTKSGI